MPKMNNQSVINRFFTNPESTNGKYIENYSGSLYITLDGKRLMNYGTCLAERNGTINKLIINRTSYSNTTSKIQSSFMNELWKQYSPSFIERVTIQVDNVKINTTYLEEAANEKLEWMKGIKEVKLINYFDVWGNKKDGWEVNNLCEETTFKLHEESTNKEVLQALKSVGFLKNTTRINQVDINDLNDFGWEVTQRKDNKPICRLEIVHN